MLRLLSTTTCGLLALIVPGTVLSQSASTTPLVLETKIPLGNIRGRLDHLTFDSKRQRLYVAELGNDSVGIVELKEPSSVRTLTGLKEPQGIGYEPTTDTVYVANARDGSVRVFNAADLAPAGEIALGDDADNVRIDERAHRVWVGYGGGALAAIDAVTRRKVADVPLHGHPESFRLEMGGSRIFANVPDKGEIAVVDRASNRQTATWATDPLRANFPLALDESRGIVLAIFRHPAKLAAFRADDGRLLAAADTCQDSDDAFVDSRRNRVYVTCGEGEVDVFTTRGDTYASIGRIPTISGARTGLFVPELDRLFVAARATSSSPAAVWVFRPVP